MSTWTITPTEDNLWDQNIIRIERMERSCYPSENAPRFPDPGRCMRHHRWHGFALTSERRKCQYGDDWHVVWHASGGYEGETREESVRHLMSDAIINGNPRASEALHRAIRYGDLPDWFDAEMGCLVRQRMQWQGPAVFAIPRA